MRRGTSNPRLDKTTLLDIELSSICSRNRYTSDPAEVIEELRARAGRRTDLLAQVAGSWAGYYEDEYTRELCEALKQIPGAEPWIELGKKRRGAAPHSAPMTERASPAQLPDEHRI